MAYLFDLCAKLAGASKRWEGEGRMSYVDHNKFIDIRVPVLIEPAVGERHLLCSSVLLPLIGGFKDYSGCKALALLHFVVDRRYV